MGRRAKGQSAGDGGVAGVGSGGGGDDEGHSEQSAHHAKPRILSAVSTETVHRTSIQFADYNPRQMSPDEFRRLRRSVKRFGLVERPIVNRRSPERGWPTPSTPTVVGGHQRLRAVDAELKTQDYRLDVNFIDVDEATERSLNIALNNPALQAQFDAEALQGVVEWLAEHGAALDDTGYTEPEFSLLFGDDFAKSLFKEQADEESPYIAQLQAMRDARREGERGEQGEGGDMEASEDASGEGGEPGESGEPTSNDPRRQPAGQSSPPATRDDVKSDVKSDLARKRQSFKDKFNQDNGDHALILVFDSSGELAAFIERYSLPHNRYIDAQQFAELVGVEWPEVTGEDGGDSGENEPGDAPADDLFS